MAWLCVDENGQECIFDNRPTRHTDGSGLGYWSRHEEDDYCNVDLPKGTIKKLIGHELTWKDEPALYDGFHDFEDKPIKVENKKKNINWRILALSIIWSLILICLSDFVMSRDGKWKWISIILVTIVTSLVFYFGYKDVNIDMNSSYTEDEKDFFNK